MWYLHFSCCLFGLFVSVRSCLFSLLFVVCFIGYEGFALWACVCAGFEFCLWMIDCDCFEWFLGVIQAPEFAFVVCLFVMLLLMLVL